MDGARKMRDETKALGGGTTGAREGNRVRNRNREDEQTWRRKEQEHDTKVARASTSRSELSLAGQNCTYQFGAQLRHRTLFHTHTRFAGGSLVPGYCCVC